MGRNKGMGGHQSALFEKDVWLTPPEIIKALGEFDLDPCAAIGCPWKTALACYTLKENGLMIPWFGRVWLNPPYGKETGAWLRRLAAHRDGTALIFARTETKDWHREVWTKADAIFFFAGRLHFHHIDGKRAKANSGAPSALVAYGHRNVSGIEQSGLKGKLIMLR